MLMSHLASRPLWLRVGLPLALILGAVATQLLGAPGATIVLFTSYGTVELVAILTRRWAMRRPVPRLTPEQTTELRRARDLHGVVVAMRHLRQLRPRLALPAAVELVREL
jgi:hypothetical protein